MGLVDAIVPCSTIGRYVVVLGQEFSVDGETAAGLAIGDYVVALVFEAGEGAALQKISRPYVPGVSPVALKGVVAQADTTERT